MGMEWNGVAWYGMAWRGMAWYGIERGEGMGWLMESQSNVI